MKRLPFRLLLVVSLLGSLALLRGSEVPLEFPRLDLTDGRKLKNVVVKTYDAKADRVLIIADGKAMFLPRTLFPPPIYEQVKGIRPSGETVTTITRVPPPTALISAAQQYQMEHPVYISRPAAPVVIAPTPPPVSPNRAAAQNAGINLNAHRAAGLKRAQQYYRHEFRTGSDSSLVMDVGIELATPQLVPGWTGRCRAEGTASLQFYDSRGRSFQRRTSRFDVVTEKLPTDDDIRIVEFTPKS